MGAGKLERRSAIMGYLWTLAIVSAVSVANFALRPSIEPTNLAMFYLLGVIVVASRFGRGEAILASLLSILIFDVAFVPPHGTIAVTDPQYLITLGTMLLVGLVVSGLTLRLRETARLSAERERRSYALYVLSRELARSRSKVEIAVTATKGIGDVFDTEIAVLAPEGPLASSASGFEELDVAGWALERAEAAGKGTATMPQSKGFYLPLLGGRGPVGVLAFLPNERNWPLPEAQRSLLETFANGIGLALERAQLAQDSQESRFLAESERMRNALLSSISHDLRTPLTSIAGAASALVDSGGGELAQTIYHESLRLNVQVQHLLDMTRLQSGEVRARLEWNSLEEIVGASLARNRELLGDRTVSIETVPALPLVRLDAELALKLFDNLFENAAAHTPPTSQIWIKARPETRTLRVIFADDGPGIPKGQEATLFDRFARGETKGEGLGLGLAICRAIMKLHEGTVWVQNRYGGGAEFHLEFPLPKEQPEVPVG